MSDQEMRQVLARLELCSMSRAASLAPTSSGQKPGSTIPSLGEKPPADHWRQQYVRARDDHEREQAHEGAERELRSITHGPGLVFIKPETKQERVARILHRKNAGWSANDVALSERVSVREVMDARTAADLDPATGKAWPADEGRDSKIRRLRGEGVAIQSIARLTDCSVRTVHYVLQRAA